MTTTAANKLDVLAPHCPHDRFTPHAEWPQFCDCDPCNTDLAAYVAARGPLVYPDPTATFEQQYLHSGMFRVDVHYDELPRLDPLHGWPVRLAWDAEPPPEKFELLALMEPRFERSFRRRRPDLRDQTDSSYDMSLAYFALSVAWTMQEVADLLIAGRRDHGDPTRANKALRRDYIERTLIKAMLNIARRTANA